MEVGQKRQHASRVSHSTCVTHHQLGKTHKWTKFKSIPPWRTGLPWMNLHWQNSSTVSGNLCVIFIILATSKPCPTSEKHIQVWRLIQEHELDVQKIHCKPRTRGPGRNLHCCGCLCAILQTVSDIRESAVFDTGTWTRPIKYIL